MSKFWNEKTRNIEPYVAGEQPKPGTRVIKLNTNENPYAPSPLIKEQLERFDPEVLRLYPDPQSEIVRKEFATCFGVSKENVFCGNGSDEVLALSFEAFFEQGKDAAPILVPDISYSFYPVYAKLYDVPIKKIPLMADFSVDVDAFLQPAGGVAIANPNAPTSLALPLSEIERIVKAHPDHVVLVDEAYVAFGCESARALLPQYPNLLIVGTLSKSHSLAGIRLGYAVGAPELIDGLCRIRDSFNSYPVDAVAQKIGALAVSDVDWCQKNCSAIMTTRERSIATLRARDFEVLESKTNFLFAKPTTIAAETLYTKLREKGILVRYFNKPRINAFLRITIGTDEEMDKLFEAIDSIMGGMK